MDKLFKISFVNLSGLYHQYLVLSVITYLGYEL